MQLDETARSRLEDIHDLEPTSNRELRERWGMNSGKEVATYLREELGSHVYRDDEKRIRARNGADIEDGGGGSADGSQDAVDDASGDGDGQPQQDPSDPAGGPENGATTAAATSKIDSDGPPTNTTDPTQQVPPHDPDVSGIEDVDGGDADDSSSSTEASPDPVLAEAEMGCPECGGELVDVRRRDFLIVADGEAVATPFGFFCSECGQGVNITEDDSRLQPSDDVAGPTGGNSSGGSGLLAYAVGGVAAIGAGVVAATKLTGRRDSDAPRRFGRG